jgi:hypothetical protein
MDTPSERAVRSDQGIDWDYIEAHHRPVTLISRPAYEGWVLSLFGVILVGLIGLFGWAGYSLSTVKAELRHVQAHVAELEPRSASGEPVPREMEQRLHAMDQRLRSVEDGTKGTMPHVTALDRHPRERADKPPEPSPPPSLPRASQLPPKAKGEVRTARDHQARRDMLKRADASRRFGAPVPDSFGKWLEWHPEWELRWMTFQFSGHHPVYLYHITYKPDPAHRYTVYLGSGHRHLETVEALGTGIIREHQPSRRCSKARRPWCSRWSSWARGEERHVDALVA